MDLLPLPLKEQANLDGKAKAEFVMSLHEQVRKNIERSTDSYRRHANKGRKEVILEPGDLVLIRLRKERFPEERKSKLNRRTDGPFRVLERINNNAYKIDLEGKYTVSSTFNIADLIPFPAGEPDLRANPFEGGGDDALRNKQEEELELSDSEDEADGELADQVEDSSSEDPFVFSSGPVTRSQAKRMEDKISALVYSKPDSTKGQDGSEDWTKLFNLWAFNVGFLN